MPQSLPPTFLRRLLFGSGYVLASYSLTLPLVLPSAIAAEHLSPTTKGGLQKPQEELPPETHAAEPLSDGERPAEDRDWGLKPLASEFSPTSPKSNCSQLEVGCKDEQSAKERAEEAATSTSWTVAVDVPLAQVPPAFAENSLDSPYTLGAGDRIKIDIFDVPEYSGEYLVLLDGTINLPILGRRNVTNLNFTQLTELLQREYAAYIVSPIITISLVAARQVNLTVSGEVRLPGVYAFGSTDATTTGQFASVTKAIELAGGITAAADVHQVEVRRIYQGEQQVFKVDLWNLLQGNNLAQDPLLRDGDTVFVPTTEIVDPDEIRQLAQSSLAPTETASFQVAVVGEVLDPGTFTVNAESEGSDNLPTVVEALRVAGGVTPRADVRRIQLRRSTRAGKDQFIIVNLWKLLKEGDISQDQVLQQGDEIFVPVAEVIDPTELEELARSRFSPDTIRIGVAGEVVSPGTQNLPANTTLNQAILAAGGFNARAYRGNVELIRLNPNGTVFRRTIEVDFENPLNEGDNPLLLNNDIIVVNRSGFAKAGDFVSTLLGPVLTGAGALLSFPFNILNLFGIGNNNN